MKEVMRCKEKEYQRRLDEQKQAASGVKQTIDTSNTAKEKTPKESVSEVKTITETDANSSTTDKGDEHNEQQN